MYQQYFDMTGIKIAAIGSNDDLCNVTGVGFLSQKQTWELVQQLRIYQIDRCVWVCMIVFASLLCPKNLIDTYSKVYLFMFGHNRKLSHWNEQVIEVHKKLRTFKQINKMLRMEGSALNVLSFLEVTGCRKIPFNSSDGAHVNKLCSFSETVNSFLTCQGQLGVSFLQWLFWRQIELSVEKNE